MYSPMKTKTVMLMSMLSWELLPTVSMNAGRRLVWEVSLCRPYGRGREWRKDYSHQHTLHVLREPIIVTAVSYLWFRHRQS